MQLSTHFTLDEFTLSQTAARLGIDNTPDAATIENLKLVAATLEIVRALLSKPIYISSGYRSPALNHAVGGAEDAEGRPISAHCLGYAADFTCAAFGPPMRIVSALADTHLQFDQLIYEFGSWVHIGVGPGRRRMVLTIDRQGTREGLHEIRGG